MNSTLSGSLPSNVRLAAAAVAACGLPLLGGCEPESAWNGSLEELLLSQPQRFGKVMSDPARHKVQVIYTQIDRDEANRPQFRSWQYRVDGAEYFYPASTVKLPVALLALEKINRLQIPHLDRDTPMLTGAVGNGQTAVTEDPTAPGGLPSVAHYIRKVLLVSDNDAFNRLYEFVGQQDINEALSGKGYAGIRILHRLDLVLGAESNRHTNPVRFLMGEETVYEQGGVYSPVSWIAPEPVLLGRAEIAGGELIDRPKDFAEKNALPLQAQHDILKALLFPESVAEHERFELSDDDYRFVYRAMSEYPGESGIESYADAAEYPQSYVKYLMFDRGEAIPGNIRIFNKIGSAYGFLTDTAYIVDFENGVEFIVAATVYTNSNDTFNDGNYEYSEIGYPFLRDLGKAIYEVELARDRLRVPDLSRFDLR